MKKLLMAAVAASAMTLCAVEKLDPKTCTEEEVRAALAEVISATNASMWAQGVSNGLWNAFSKAKFTAIRLESDVVLAEKGYAPAPWWSYSATYPRISELARTKNGADKAYVNSIAVAKRLNSNIGVASFLKDNGTFADVAIYLSEAVAFPTNCSMTVKTIDGYKKVMQKYAVKAIKKYIRSQGKSFVTKDGINPCETYMTALTAALNAPRFDGLDAWYKSIGFSGIDLSALPSEADVARLKQEVLDGEKEMTERNKAILYLCLGVDGYNAFVREYNGD